MTFQHWYFLIALGAVAVPIIIHLLNRRSAKIVDWGAMHFLMGSLVSRKRRVLMEEMLLLALRCLLIALVVLAVARPVIVAGSSMAWAITLPVVLLGSVTLGIGTAMWQHRRWRWISYGAGLGLLLLALLALVIDHLGYLNVPVGSGRDVALVIDSSASMKLQMDGRSNFARALDEARGMVKAMDRSSSVSIILAGSVPEAKTPFPLTDRDRIMATLSDLQPTGGELAIHDALQVASLSLAAGSHAAKQIVLFTDGQKAGWEISDQARWERTANELHSGQAIPPQLFCRMLEVPEKLRNLAVTELSCARKVVGMDRPLPVRAQVVNSGRVPVSACAAFLSVDGKQVDKRPVSQLDAGASETLNFSYRFETSGSHVLEVKLDVEDDLPDDNGRVHIVYVMESLPVLIVEGHPAPRLLDRGAAFWQLALDPASLAPGTGKAGAGSNSRRFVQATIVDAAQINDVKDWRKYRVVILADVPRLPDVAATRLAEYVSTGGGLMLAPGEMADAAFYNTWTAPVGAEPVRLVPALLQRRVTTPADKEAPQLAMGTLTHPALAPILEIRKNDLETARISSYWLLELDTHDSHILSGARLSDGAPWLLEGRLGRGKVLLTAGAFDLRGGNLPTRRSFVPLVHELVYHLADAGAWDLNRQPSRELILHLPVDAALAGSDAAMVPEASSPPQAVLAEVTMPDGSTRAAVGHVQDGLLALRVEHAASAGLYHVAFVPGAGSRAPTEGTNRSIPFTVMTEAAESNMEILTDSDLEMLEQYIHVQRLRNLEDLQAISGGGTHGAELWKYLTLLALVVLLAEVGLARWIALQRKANPAEIVDFTPRGGNTTAFEQELASMRAALTKGHIEKPVPAGTPNQEAK